MIYKNTYTIGMEDIGYANQATNKTILAIMEDIGSLHSASVGYGVNDIERTRVAWVILDWSVRIIRRPDYNETVHAATWATKMDRAFAYRDFELTDDAGEVIAIGCSRWILMNLDERRPERLKPELGELFQIEAGKMSFPEGDPSFRDLNHILAELTEEEKQNDYEYKVERRDIDVNGHVHNLNYLDAAYEALPEEVYAGEECNCIRITYKKEIKYGDSVGCQYYYKDQKHYVVMATDNTTHAIILLHE